MKTEEQKKNLIEWAKALESGKYPQTRGLLNRVKSGIGVPAGMCCLGVACVIAQLPSRLLADDRKAFCFDGTWDSISINPEWAKHRFGIENQNISTLMSLNDREMLSFKDIAMVIRKWAGE